MTQSSFDHTPLMKQYHEIKHEHKNALVLFQVGDFYELFYDDAKKAAACLGIALTARGKNKGEPIPLCGVPVHAINHYLPKLIKHGFNIALCEQLEPPKPGTVVKRGVTRVFTPGTLTDAPLLDAKSPSYLLTLVPSNTHWSLLFGELLTAQLFVTVIESDAQSQLDSELIRYFPDEIIIPSTPVGKTLRELLCKQGYCVTTVDPIIDEQSHAQEWINQQFKASQTLIEQQESVKNALYYFYAYMRKNQADALIHFNYLQWYKPEDFLLLDSATQRNLEIIHPLYQGSTSNTLFAVMDHAQTAMGSRLIKKWLVRPLLNQQAIEQRLDVVEYFMGNISIMRSLEQLCKQLGDLERIVGRIALGRGQLHDYIALRNALLLLPSIKDYIVGCKHELASLLADYLDEYTTLCDLLHAALPEDSINDMLIRPGFDATLDQLRTVINSSQQLILNLEKQEQEKTGINSLKIRFNQVYGYYVEITKANADLVPAHYIRQQTLVGRERYMMPELQQLQYAITQAQTHINQHEKKVFEQIKQEVQQWINQLRKSAYSLSYLDALLSFARCAYQYGYVRPQFNQERNTSIIQSRHPVVERSMHYTFIPNDIILNNEQSLLIITGPNMGGKSTFLRQTALIAIMAQAGSYVPAQAANLPLFDRIFTRIGSGDNVAGGKSTFLVEMEETATICSEATERSLVILDEVGRGTSTFDGLAIAQAVVEYIYTQIKARCLFATHYHELTQLAVQFPAIANYYASSKKTERGILLLYKLVLGIADGSFGIEVAKTAQLPAIIIDRAQQLVYEFEGGAPTVSNQQKKISQPSEQIDVELLKRQEKTNRIFNELKQIDYNELSPKQAFDLLWRLKDLLTN